MNKTQKKLVTLSTVLAIGFGIYPAANAMHIMEGYLPVTYCVAWGILCVPFLITGFFSLKKTIQEHRKTLILLAMAGAYAFVLSALKIPSVTGSSSHMTGTGLGAILFGPCATGILGLIVLLFQAVLLAHGGLTTLGANTFSMAIAGPLLTFGIYKLCQKLKLNRMVTIFLAASLGDLFTYCITSFQLALAYFRSRRICRFFRQVYGDFCSDPGTACNHRRTSDRCRYHESGILRKIRIICTWILQRRCFKCQVKQNLSLFYYCSAY